MPTTNSPSSVPPATDRVRNDREAILEDLEEYRTLLYEPLPAAEINERLLRTKIDTLLDRLNQLSNRHDL